MTTGTTNLDILELTIPSIDADEIASGSAAAGEVLTADGLGGAAWQTPGAGPIDANSIQGLIRFTWNQLASPDGPTLSAIFAAIAGRAPADGDALLYFDTNEGGVALAIWFDSDWARFLAG